MAHNNYGKEYKDMSGKGKKEIPGQFRLDVTCQDVKLVEQRPQLCKPYYSKKYWEAFRDFLSASGVFGRTWHLYKQLRDDPTPETLIADINRCNNPVERARIESQLKGVMERITVMKTRQKCETKEELFDKASSDWDDYKRKLKNLISYSRNANVPIAAEEGQKVFRNIMVSFVLLDDSVRGSCRREYYRDKFVNRSLKQVKKTGYADPISIYDMEAAFKADKDWQDKFLRRKKK